MNTFTKKSISSFMIAGLSIGNLYLPEAQAEDITNVVESSRLSDKYDPVYEDIYGKAGESIIIHPSGKVPNEKADELAKKFNYDLDKMEEYYKKFSHEEHLEFFSDLNAIYIIDLDENDPDFGIKFHNIPEEEKQEWIQGISEADPITGIGGVKIPESAKNGQSVTIKMSVIYTHDDIFKVFTDEEINGTVNIDSLDTVPFTIHVSQPIDETDDKSEDGEGGNESEPKEPENPGNSENTPEEPSADTEKDNNTENDKEENNPGEKDDSDNNNENSENKNDDTENADTGSKDNDIDSNSGSDNGKEGDTKENNSDNTPGNGDNKTDNADNVSKDDTTDHKKNDSEKPNHDENNNSIVGRIRDTISGSDKEKPDFSKIPKDNDKNENSQENSIKEKEDKQTSSKVINNGIKGNEDKNSSNQIENNKVKGSFNPVAPINPSRVNQTPSDPSGFTPITGPGVGAILAGGSGTGKGAVVDTGGTIQESFWTKIVNLFR